jgi:hypothetical protein
VDHPIAKVRKEHGDSEQPARAQNGALACPFLHWMLLKFTHPVHLGILLDSSMRQTWIDISARLSGEIPLPCEAFAPNTDADVLLHSRNIFRVGGNVTMPLGKCHVMASNGNLIPITAQKLTVSAVENLGGKPVEIALATPQKLLTRSTSGRREDNAENNQLPNTLPIVKSQQVRSNNRGMVNLSFFWGRLQFPRAPQEKDAAVHLQETLRVRVQVIATLSTGAEAPVSEIFS